MIWELLEHVVSFSSFVVSLVLAREIREIRRLEKLGQNPESQFVGDYRTSPPLPSFQSPDKSQTKLAKLKECPICEGASTLHPCDGRPCRTEGAHTHAACGTCHAVRVVTE
jgi:hypothetical protein